MECWIIENGIHLDRCDAVRDLDVTQFQQAVAQTLHHVRMVRSEIADAPNDFILVRNLETELRKRTHDELFHGIAFQWTEQSRIDEVEQGTIGFSQRLAENTLSAQHDPDPAIGRQCPQHPEESPVRLSIRRDEPIHFIDQEHQAFVGGGILEQARQALRGHPPVAPASTPASEPP